jgi:hypothetical protein
MSFCRTNRLRALILMLAFALIGQANAPEMAMLPGQDSMAGMSMKSSNMCPGCAGVDHSAAVPLDCMVGLCSGVVAILSAPAPQISPSLRATYMPTVFQGEPGITITPDPAPPKRPRLA